MAVPYLIRLFACYSCHIHDGRDVRRRKGLNGRDRRRDEGKKEVVRFL